MTMQGPIPPLPFSYGCLHHTAHTSGSGLGPYRVFFGRALSTTRTTYISGIRFK